MIPELSDSERIHLLLSERVKTSIFLYSVDTKIVNLDFIFYYTINVLRFSLL